MLRLFLIVASAAALIEGSKLTLDEIIEKAPRNWYLTAREALARKLVAGLKANSTWAAPFFSAKGVRHVSCRSLL